jgi:RNA recognition motif-containing protein
MNNFPSTNNSLTASTEWNKMDNGESRNASTNTSNKNIQEPTTRLPSRDLPQNTTGDGMNNQYEAVNITNINKMNINYDRMGGQSDKPALDKLHPPMSPSNCKGEVGDSANSHGYSVASLETNGELEESLPNSMENPWTNGANLTGSVPLMSSLNNGRNAPMSEPYPYVNMHSPPNNSPTSETNVMFSSKSTFKDHKNDKTGSQMRQYYPHGYMGSYPFSNPSSHQPPQNFIRSMDNAHKDNEFIPGTTQNGSSNKKGYSHTNGQTNAQKYATQSATTSSPGEAEAIETPQHISNAIVIKNIPFDVRKEQLQVLMKDLKLPSPYAFNYHFDKEGFFRGLAFANFHHDWEATEVIKALNGYVIRERALRVELKIMLKAGERETVEREKRMKRGQFIEQHKPISPDKIESLPRLLTPESPIPATIYSRTPGQQQQHDISLQKPFPASTFNYTTSGNAAPSLFKPVPSSYVLTIINLVVDDRQTPAAYPQRQAPLRQPQGPPSLQDFQSPSWRPIREQPRLTGQKYRAHSNQYGIIGDRMARPLGGTAPSQV